MANNALGAWGKDAFQPDIAHTIHTEREKRAKVMTGTISLKTKKKRRRKCKKHLRGRCTEKGEERIKRVRAVLHSGKTKGSKNRPLRKRTQDDLEKNLGKKNHRRRMEKKRKGGVTNEGQQQAIGSHSRIEEKLHEKSLTNS